MKAKAMKMIQMSIPSKKKAKEMKMKKNRSVRIAEQLWRKAQAKAKAEGKTASEVIVDFLKEYIK